MLDLTFETPKPKEIGLASNATACSGASTRLGDDPNANVASGDPLNEKQREPLVAISTAFRQARPVRELANGSLHCCTNRPSDLFADERAPVLPPARCRLMSGMSPFSIFRACATIGQENSKKLIGFNSEYFFDHFSGAPPTDHCLRGLLNWHCPKSVD